MSSRIVDFYWNDEKFQREDQASIAHSLLCQSMVLFSQLSGLSNSNADDVALEEEFSLVRARQ